MPIIISENGQNAIKVDKTNFDREDYLQQYIHQNPESIPLYDIKEDINLLILAREFPTNSGPIDAIAFDKEGEIYIVETKLYKNPDKRTVIAQALDYGAALWKHANSFTEFTAVLEQHAQKTWSQTLTDKLADQFNLSDEEVVLLLEKVKDNLNDGIFHFVILMDKLDNRLKDLILYVNQNSQFDIYAVELEYYKHQTFEIIIPRLYGAEVKKDIAVRQSVNNRKKWDEKTFFEDANNKLTSDQFQAVKRLYEFSKDVADEIGWGTGATNASFVVKFNKISDKSLYTVYSNGKLSLNFGWLHHTEEAVKYRDKFKELLNQEIPELEVNNDNQDYPKRAIEVWQPTLNRFEKVIINLVK